MVTLTIKPATTFIRALLPLALTSEHCYLRFTPETSHLRLVNRIQDAIVDMNVIPSQYHTFVHENALYETAFNPADLYAFLSIYEDEAHSLFFDFAGWLNFTVTVRRNGVNVAEITIEQVDIVQEDVEAFHYTTAEQLGDVLAVRVIQSSFVLDGFLAMCTYGGSPQLHISANEVKLRIGNLCSSFLCDDIPIEGAMVVLIDREIVPIVANMIVLGVQFNLVLIRRIGNDGQPFTSTALVSPVSPLRIFIR